MNDCLNCETFTSRVKLTIDVPSPPKKPSLSSMFLLLFYQNVNWILWNMYAMLHAFQNHLSVARVVSGASSTDAHHCSQQPNVLSWQPFFIGQMLLEMLCFTWCIIIYCTSFSWCCFMIQKRKHEDNLFVAKQYTVDSLVSSFVFIALLVLHQLFVQIPKKYM